MVEGTTQDDVILGGGDASLAFQVLSAAPIVRCEELTLAVKGVVVDDQYWLAGYTACPYHCQKRTLN